MTEYQTQVRQAVTDLLQVEPRYEVEYEGRVYDFQIPDVAAENPPLFRLLIHIDTGDLSDRDKEQIRSEAGADLQTVYFPTPGENVYPRIVQFAQRCKARQIQDQVHDLEVELDDKEREIKGLEARLRAEESEHEETAGRVERFGDELHRLRYTILREIEEQHNNLGAVIWQVVHDSGKYIPQEVLYLARAYYRNDLHAVHRDRTYKPRRSPRRRRRSRGRKSSSETK